jgi:hypothetical protein
LETTAVHSGQKMAINSLELNILGWNSWFDDQGREYCQPEQQMARVTAVDRGWYTVRNEAGEVREFTNNNIPKLADPCYSSPEEICFI